MDRILVIAAHPDDEILGCGATVRKHINAGGEASALVLGEGITSRYERREDAPAEELKALDQCFVRVCQHMGFSSYWHKDLPDNRFDSLALLDVVKVVEATIAEVKPDVIYTHFEGDLNIDHRVTFQAVLTACRPQGTNAVKEIYSFEVPSSTEWISPAQGTQFCPNVYVEVADTLQHKIDAMKLYDSELAPFPHPRSPEALEVIAKRWGVAAGLPAAEAFQLIRKIG